MPWWSIAPKLFFKSKINLYIFSPPKSEKDSWKLFQNKNNYIEKWYQIQRKDVLKYSSFGGFTSWCLKISDVAISFFSDADTDADYCLYLFADADANADFKFCADTDADFSFLNEFPMLLY